VNQEVERGNNYRFVQVLCLFVIHSNNLEVLIRGERMHRATLVVHDV
jgi:hypothetical protein